METILTVAVIVFIALMIFIGQHRGMIKMIFSLASMLIVLILVQILTPITKDFIETTPVYDAISKQVTQYVDEKIVDVSDSISQTGETAQKNDRFCVKCIYIYFAICCFDAAGSAGGSFA